MTIKIPAHLSYSALTKYMECGERYRLERYHLDNSTWWATIAGSVIHAVTESYDRGEYDEVPYSPAAPHVFAEALEKEIAEQKERGREIKASGKVLKERGWTGGPNKKDKDWWLHYGPKIIQAYIDWREAHSDWVIVALPERVPGIEVEFNIEVGGVPVTGYIDRVFYDPSTGQYIVVDIKTGQEPKSDLQLGTYALALWRVYGVRVVWGGYLSPYDEKESVPGPKGGTTKKSTGNVRMGIAEIKYLGFDDEYVDYLFESARAAIENGIFLPSPSMMCSGCPVNEYCRAQQGDKSQEYPVYDLIEVYEPYKPQAEKLSNEEGESSNG